jgi:crotonobetainyl-CoA:carnitine CoA-transferase CaiB-like acyl-CoA transferase
MAEAKGPLRGVRVLDLTRVWSGPLCTRILADFGAEVIKVEHRASRGPAAVPASYARASGFYPQGEPGQRPWNRHGFFNEMNRNKLSLTLDLACPEGRGLFLRLVAISDAVVENFSPRVLPNLGLDYGRLRQAREDIVLVSLPAYGLEGPYRQRVAYGTNLETEAGLTALMGYADGRPQRLGAAITDPIAGVMGAAATVLALLRRRQTGQGAHVEVSQLGAAVNFVGQALLALQLLGTAPAPLGNRHPWRAPQGCYPCRGHDRWLALSVGDDRQWEGLCAALGRPDLARDARFATFLGRWQHQDELDAIIVGWTRGLDAHEAMQALQQAGVPAAAVLDGADLARDEHLHARRFYVSLRHPDAGTHSYPGQPIRLGRTPATFRSDAPALGEHNRYVLQGLLGLSEEELERLEAAGIIGQRPP